ncbi:MAG: peptide chain release factor N(5)-glutamine methyltransferase [Candidatus Moraniibacteriota bacterium]
MTIREITQKMYSKYKLSPIDMGILLSLAGNFSKEHILAHPEKKLSAMQTKKFDSFCARRASGEPVAYIAGKKEFFGLEFLVNKDVLIPRPETELLVEETIKKINKFFAETRLIASLHENDKLTVIDVGTGSGNIIISIAKNIPQIFQKKTNFYAIDISKESLRVAKANTKKHKVDKKIKLVQSDMLEYFVKRKIKLENILIVANLPYVSENIYKQNYKNLKYEPKKALLSGRRGLQHYKDLFAEIKKILITAHCSLFIEFSPEQKPEIGRIIKKCLPKAKTKFFKDLAGKWRMTEVKT